MLLFLIFCFVVQIECVDKRYVNSCLISHTTLVSIFLVIVSTSKNQSFTTRDLVYENK